MASFQVLQQGEMLKRTKLFAISDVTKWPAMQVQYVGDKLYAKVTVDAATGDVTFKADDTDGATTTILTLDVSETPHDTFGECVDAINAVAGLRAFLIGVPRNASSINKLDTLSATDIRTDNGLTLYADEATAGLLDQGFAVTNNKFTGRPTGGFSTKEDNWTTDELCENILNYLYVKVTAVGDANIEIYACDDINKTDAPILIWDNAAVTATAEEHGNTIPAEPFIKAPLNHRLLIYFDCAAANTAADVRATCTTKHMTGLETPGANYTGIA